MLKIFNKQKKEKVVEKINCFIEYNTSNLNSNIIININKKNNYKFKAVIDNDINEKEKNYCQFPKFEIQTIIENNSDSSYHKVLLSNNFVNLENYYLDQDPFNLYKIGLCILKELSLNNYINLEKISIEAIEKNYLCEYCGTPYKIIYNVYYDKKFIFSTKHNGFYEENNCPFLFNLEETTENNLVLNKDIIAQILFELLKQIYKDKINFYLIENNNKKDCENLSRIINKNDCCIGFGKDNLLNKAINIYKHFENNKKNEMIIIIATNYVKIIKNKNKLNFYDIKNNIFSEYLIKENRHEAINDISIILSKKFNLLMGDKL